MRKACLKSVLFGVALALFALRAEAAGPDCQGDFTLPIKDATSLLGRLAYRIGFDLEAHAIAKEWQRIARSVTPDSIHIEGEFPKGSTLDLKLAYTAAPERSHQAECRNSSFGITDGGERDQVPGSTISRTLELGAAQPTGQAHASFELVFKDVLRKQYPAVSDERFEALFQLCRFKVEDISLVTTLRNDAGMFSKSVTITQLTYEEKRDKGQVPEFPKSHAFADRLYQALTRDGFGLYSPAEFTTFAYPADERRIDLRLNVSGP